MRKQLVIITSGHVGYELLNWLIQKNSKIFHVFSTGNKCDSQIKSLCLKYKIKYSNYSKKNILQIFEKNPPNKFWLISLWNPYILSHNLIKKAYDTVNLHPSYLPYVRGNDTAAWTLIKREIAGVSINRLHQKLDCGDIWARKKIKYKNMTKGIELYDQMIFEIIVLFKLKWLKIYNKNIKLIKNTCKSFEKSRNDTNKDRIIYWNKNYKASELIYKILAHDFSDKSSALLKYKSKKYKIRIQFD